MKFKLHTKMKVPIDRSRSRRREKLKDKKCQFPGCNKIFISTGKAKFCPEHRASKYRKIIDKDKIEIKRQENIEAQKVNQVIKYENVDIDKVTIKMFCDCCHKEYTIDIIHGVFVYPRYCPEHRNEYKRKRYMEDNK